MPDEQNIFQTFPTYSAKYFLVWLTRFVQHLLKSPCCLKLGIIFSTFKHELLMFLFCQLFCKRTKQLLFFIIFSSINNPHFFGALLHPQFILLSCFSQFCGIKNSNISLKSYCNCFEQENSNVGVCKKGLNKVLLKLP